MTEHPRLETSVNTVIRRLLPYSVYVWWALTHQISPVPHCTVYWCLNDEPIYNNSVLYLSTRKLLDIDIIASGNYRREVRIASQARRGATSTANRGALLAMPIDSSTLVPLIAAHALSCEFLLWRPLANWGLGNQNTHDRIDWGLGNQNTHDRMAILLCAPQWHKSCIPHRYKELISNLLAHNSCALVDTYTIFCIHLPGNVINHKLCGL